MRVQALILVVVIASYASAQGTPKADAWLPKGDPGEVVNFEDVCIGKVSADQKAVLLARPSFRESKNEERTLSKTVYSTETRTRKVIGPDGKATEESYTVQVPFVITEQKMHVVKSAYASQKLSLPIDQVRAWDIAGNPIDTKELVKRLTKQTYLLAMERPKEESFEPIDAFYRSIIRPDTIVIYLDLGGNYALTTPASQSATPPQP